MGLLERFKRREEDADEEYAETLADETAKVRAYKTAEEVAAAAKVLMEKATQLRKEVEALANE